MIEKKDIQGFEGLYAVSRDGKVHILYKEWRSANGNKRICHPKELKSSLTKHGYLKVTLSKDGKAITKTVHSLIADAFLDHEDGKTCINHIDGDKTNNNVSNLERCTYSENINHSYRIGLRVGKSNMKGRFNELNGRSRSVRQLNLSGEVIKLWPSMMEVERILKINSGNISSCASGKIKTAYGFKWEYN